MKLIQEANLDDSFNNELMKVDAAYEKLAKLAGQFSLEKRPVRSQVRMLESVADDFKKLASKLADLNKAPNK
jgi:hypothetical protein